MQTVTAAWALSLLVGTQPVAPWRETYEATAAAMAESANSDSLFAADDGPARTVAYYVSVSWFESNHNPRAEGDCRDSKGASVDCKTAGATPHSFCLGQIHDSNFAALGVTRDALLEDVGTCVHAMHVMLKQSLHLCSARWPSEQEAWLSWYTGGGPDCETRTTKSAHRVLKAKWLFARFPVR